MSFRSWMVVLFAVALDATGAEPAARSAPADSVSPTVDLCQGPVDPYLVGQERTRFLHAAGVDGEMSREEFETDRGRTDGFARAFDRWDALRAFDKNRNSTLDWFEADDYRRDFRAKVLGRFDADKNGRLSGEERIAANRALAAGRLTDRPKNVRADTQVERSMLRQYDTDGDGRLSEAEKDAALADFQRRQRQRVLDRYDTDGDGRLSPEERAAMRNEEEGAFRQRLEDWKLRDFDANGDGKLSEEENEALREFQRQLGQAGRQIDLRFSDLDGDGEVSPEERREIGEQWRRQRWKVMVRFAGLMDSDGDGQVAGEEMQEFGRRARTAVLDWMEDFSLRYDDDYDGRLLDPGEREAMVEGLREELDIRLTRHDKDASGHLQPDEVLDFAEEFLTEVGVVRRPQQPEPAEDQSK